MSTETTNLPYQLTLRLPFVEAKHAYYVEKSLSPDKDLKPDQAVRHLKVLEGLEAEVASVPSDDAVYIANPTQTSSPADSKNVKAILQITVKAVTDRVLRVNVNSTLDAVAVVLEAVETLGGR